LAGSRISLIIPTNCPGPQDFPDEIKKRLKKRPKWAPGKQDRPIMLMVNKLRTFHGIKISGTRAGVRKSKKKPYKVRKKGADITEGHAKPETQTQTETELKDLITLMTMGSRKSCWMLLQLNDSIELRAMTT